MDAKLNWNAYIAQATYRGAVAFAVVLCIAVSTWGLLFRHTRLLYTAVVRPIMLYGSQIWGIGLNGKLLAKSSLVSLEKLQNQCLCRITGVYKRTLRAAIKCKAVVPLLNIYIKAIAMQRAFTVQSYPVKEKIC